MWFYCFHRNHFFIEKSISQKVKFNFSLCFHLRILWISLCCVQSIHVCEKAGTNDAVWRFYCCSVIKRKSKMRESSFFVIKTANSGVIIAKRCNSLYLWRELFIKKVGLSLVDPALLMGEFLQLCGFSFFFLPSVYVFCFPTIEHDVITDLRIRFFSLINVLAKYM